MSGISFNISDWDLPQSYSLYLNVDGIEFNTRHIKGFKKQIHSDGTIKSYVNCTWMPKVGQKVGLRHLEYEFDKDDPKTYPKFICVRVEKMKDPCKDHNGYMVYLESRDKRIDEILS